MRPEKVATPLLALTVSVPPRVLPPGLLENTSTGAITGLAAFTDPAGVEPDGVAAYTATINWGDGGADTGTIVSLGGGVFRVDAPAHTYVEEGTYTVNVTLTHDALAAVTTPNQTIVVSDQQITTPAASNLPASGLEGASVGAIASIATFTDPAGVGAEIGMQVMERGFDDLDAPVARLNGLHTPTPYSPSLEAAVVPNADTIERAIRDLLAE